MAALSESMVGSSYRIREDGARLEWDLRGKCDEVRRTAEDIPGEPPVGVHAEHRLVGTEIIVAAPAVGTLPAPCRSANDHAVSGLPWRGILAALFDHPSDLVPKDDRGLPDGDVAAPHVDVGPADARRFNAHDRLAGAGFAQRVRFHGEREPGTLEEGGDLAGLWCCAGGA